jgi:hypothetical protein
MTITQTNKHTKLTAGLVVCLLARQLPSHQQAMSYHLCFARIAVTRLELENGRWRYWKTILDEDKATGH